MEKEKQKKSEASGARDKALTVIGIVLCVILAPILIVNCIMIIQSFTDSEKVPGLFGYSPMIVLTDSMEPVLVSGDMVVLHHTDPSELREGDVIAFFDPEGNGTSVVTHRIAAVLPDGDGTFSFTTKGDANNTADKLPVTGEKVVGKYVFRIPGLGKAALFMRTAPGLILCVGVPVVLLFGYDFIRRRLYERNRDRDTEALLAELAALKAEKGSGDEPAEEKAPQETSGKDGS